MGRVGVESVLARVRKQGPGSLPAPSDVQPSPPPPRTSMCTPRALPPASLLKHALHTPDSSRVSVSLTGATPDMCIWGGCSAGEAVEG
jgi:hypothetical protein